TDIADDEDKNTSMTEKNVEWHISPLEFGESDEWFEEELS
ncbi:2056_t:CDS:1, partial [Funneliformis caledonium]